MCIIRSEGELWKKKLRSGYEELCRLSQGIFIFHMGNEEFYTVDFKSRFFFLYTNKQITRKTPPKTQRYILPTTFTAIFS